MHNLLKSSKYTLPLIFGVLFVYCIKLINKTFLPLLETRDGYRLFDPILHILPSVDLSIPIFILLYSSILLGFMSLWKTPNKLMIAIYTSGIMYLIRLLCIIAVPLEAPKGLIPLYDPIVNKLVLHSQFLTKDLFFSGHLASVFIFYVISKNKAWKNFFLISTTIMATFILIQHIHYTIDILGAIIFTYLSVELAKIFVKKIVIYSRVISISVETSFLYNYIKNNKK